MAQSRSTSKMPSKAGRACSVCSGPLTRQTLEGVDFSVCAEHGVWLDKSQLASLVRTMRVRRKQRRNLQRELSTSQTIIEERGFFSGMWAMMLMR